MPRMDDAPISPVDFKAISARVRRLWGPDAPHQLIVSQTRGGKSFLFNHGLCPLLRKDSRVLTIDSKGDDPTVSDFPGHAVDRLPSRWWRGTRRDRNQWFRLVARVEKDNWQRVRDRVERALDLVMAEGDWVVFFDEGRSIVGREAPDLGLRANYSHMIRLGGYKGVRAVTASQTTSWMPGEAWSQFSLGWLGKIEDEDGQARLGEIGGSRRRLRAHLPAIRKRFWLYTDAEDDERFYGITKIPGPHNYDRSRR